MAMADQQERTIPVGETDAGEPYHFPVEDLLTARAFVTGKSGSGKSNTASVILEELLERNHAFLVVDVEGEYYGLKEDHELLHVGATDQCDLQVGPEHAAKLATLALEQLVPIILDVSGYVDEDVVDELVAETARELFAKEQDALQPFLLLVEEIHEYLPQQGALGEAGGELKRIAKRGRKRGLGIAGVSQRPADVEKSFITQADLLVWHRLTWDSDTKLVRRVIDAAHADRVEDLPDGGAFVQADWSETDVETVQFRRKHTFDAGAAPGLDDVDRPELKSIDEDLVEELHDISEQHDRRQDRIAELERKLNQRDERIGELEAELQQAQDMSDMAEQFTSALLQQGGGDDDVQQTIEAKVMEVREAKREAENRVDELETELNAREERISELKGEVERLSGIEERVDQAEAIESNLEEIKAWFGSAPASLRETAGGAHALFANAGDAEGVDVDEALQEENETLRQQLQNARDRLEGLEAQSGSASDGFAALVNHDAVQAAVDTAKEESDRAGEHFDRVLAVLASAEDGGPLGVGEIEPLTEVSETTVRQVLKELHRTGIVRRKTSGRKQVYALDEEFLQRRIDVHEQQVV